jgi:hypothetical protein
MQEGDYDKKDNKIVQMKLDVFSVKKIETVHFAATKYLHILRKDSETCGRYY